MHERKPEAEVLEFPKEVAVGAEVIGKRYEYEGKPGRIKVDGVEVAVETLTDSERVDAGEQLLKRISLSTNTSVSDLRKQLSGLAKSQPPSAPKPQLRMVQTSGGLRPMLTTARAPNRKARLEARAKARHGKRSK